MARCHSRITLKMCPPQRGHYLVETCIPLVALTTIRKTCKILLGAIRVTLMEAMADSVISMEAPLATWMDRNLFISLIFQGNQGK